MDSLDVTPAPGPGMDVEFGLDVSPVDVDGVQGDAQVGGDVAVLAPGPRPLHHLHLAWRQRQPPPHREPVAVRERQIIADADADAYMAHAQMEANAAAKVSGE